MTPDYPKPPFPAQKQPTPGLTDAMHPRPDHGETSYKGSGKPKGMKAVITGGDSGIGRAVAIAFAREGADVLIAFLNETEEATEVKKLIEKEGRKAVLVPGDLQDAKHCREVIKKAVDGLGGSPLHDLQPARRHRSVISMCRWVTGGPINGTS